MSACLVSKTFHLLRGELISSGYAAIYCVGLSTGEHIMRAIAPARQSAVYIRSQEEHIQRHIDKRRTELALELFSYAFGWWIAVLAVRLSGYEISRRIVSPGMRWPRLTSGKSDICPLGSRIQYHIPFWLFGFGNQPLFVKRQPRPAPPRGHQQQRSGHLSRRQCPDWTDQSVDADNVRQ